MTWDNFYLLGIISAILWLCAALIAYKDRRKTAIVLQILGIIVFSSFIVGLWITLQRPVLRTMGETRLWYSFFMAFAGLITYLRWRYKWILSFTSVMSLVFIIINIAKPQIHSQALMPALQSAWFIPHVTIYMFSYAMLGCAFIISVIGLIKDKPDYIYVCDKLVAIGVACLSLGMFMGALWAKQAWGHYWSWDIKETWAAITWLSYLLYAHLRIGKKQKRKLMYVVVIISFVFLQMTWYGVNYLPSSSKSAHTYNRN